MLQCTGLRSLFKPLAVASLMYRHSVPLVLFRLEVCCCLRRDVDARNGSGRVLRGGGRNHEVTLSMCAVGEQLPTMFSVVSQLLYCSSHCRIVTSVHFSSQLRLNLNIVFFIRCYLETLQHLWSYRVWGLWVCI